MGQIESVINLFTVQTCVYWGNPVTNGKGGWTFDAPIELTPPNGVRWDEKQEIKIGYDGNQFTSQAVVLVNQDLDRRGYLFNGTLVELQALATAGGLDINEPVEFVTAFIIQQFEKIPMVFADDDFVRTAYLYNQG